MNQKLAQDYDEQIYQHTKANLLVRMEKLLQYDDGDLDSVAFERNFRECQKLYEELPDE